MSLFDRAIQGFFRTACVLMLAAPGLHAQLNPKWQSTACHDFLDLYQQNNAVKIRPEIVTLFDFSTSMDRIMFHPAFAPSNDHKIEDGVRNYYSVKVSLLGLAGSRRVSLSFPQTDGNLAKLSSYTITGTQLIRPDGNPVTESMVANTKANSKLPRSENGAADVRNWVRAASHARLSFTGGKLGSTLRTIDIPLHWCIIDPQQALSDSDPTLKSLKIQDPKAPTNYYEVDSNYLDENGSGIVRRLEGNYAAVTIYEGAGTWRWDYVEWLLTAQDSNGKYLIGDAVQGSWNDTGRPWVAYGPKDAEGNYRGLPRHTRLQAMKQSVLMMWYKYQDDVAWAYRGLDKASYTEPGDSTNADPPSSVVVPTDNTTDGYGRKWYSMVAPAKGSAPAHAGAQRLAKLVTAWNGTPLVSSYADTIVQYQATSPWSYLEGSDKPPRDCTKHFVVIFTDGVPNEEGTYKEWDATTPSLYQPYWVDAKSGNTSLKANPSWIDANGNYWNIPTLAGAAAHAVDPGKLTGVQVADPKFIGSGTKPVSTFLPFSIGHRADYIDSTGKASPNVVPPHPIQTLTVGVSLGVEPGHPENTNTPSFRLRAAALFGNPSDVTWTNPSETIPYNWRAATHDEKEAFYFDGISPEDLVNSLDSAFQYMMGAPSTNVTAMPSIPYVGIGLGHQIYLGRFDPPQKGGPAWPGELMMFPTKEQGGQTVILDQSGAAITGDLKAATPGWKASTALHTRGWQNRVIYTRLPSSSGSWNPAIQRVSDSGTNWDAIKTYIPGYSATNEAQAKKNLRWIMGADTSSKASPLPTRQPDESGVMPPGVIDIMGDIIDSSPIAVEYTTLNTGDLPSGSPLGAAWDAALKKDRRFRIVFVGTNQGHFHAFGEVSWQENIGTTEKPSYLTKATVDELWSFIPTDVFRFMDYYQTPTNPHRAAVNGVPQFYHLDLPAKGALRGNGKVDSDNTAERATVLFGLGKGGRSYYALDVRDPMKPKLGGEGNLGWAIVPDEPTSYPSDRFAANASSTVIKNMGLSTCVPAVGRAVVGSVMKDVVFLGGGFSCPETEDKQNAGTPMGRSVIAIDVKDGQILQTWDHSSASSTVGPISVGVVPFRMFLNVGLTQRLYYTDLYGGLWAINGGEASSLAGFRTDSSDMSKWIKSARPVYKQSGSNGVISTLPAPFKVGTFYPKSDGTIPAAVGIAMVSGNRNDPLELSFSNKNQSPYDVAPSQHRMTVVFDRQDSAGLGLDSTGITDDQLEDFTAQSDPASLKIQPGKPEFYLNSKYGYYLNFWAKGSDPNATSFLSKGIVPPIVLTGVAFYSVFTPMTVDPCTGGSGHTYTYRVCDVMRPVFPGNNTLASSSSNTDSCDSGRVADWYGVASNIAAKSVVAVIQAGTVQGTAIDPNTGLPVTPLLTKSFTGKPSSKSLQPRTWRTVNP